MSLTDQSADIEAQLTDQARTMIARATLGEVVFTVTGFGLGRGGFNPTNVVQTTPLDTALPTLIDKCYPDETDDSKAAFITVEEPSHTVRVYNCRVGVSTFVGEADYALGELGLYAEIIKSNVGSEVGQTFLYAVSHFPVIAKTRRDTLLRRVIINY